MIDIDALFPLRSERMTAALEAAPRNLITANALLNYRRPGREADERYGQTAGARRETFQRHVPCRPDSHLEDGPMEKNDLACLRLFNLFDQPALPTVTLLEADETTRRPAIFDALRELVLERCHYSLFDELADLDRLIEHSGGHLRDLLRLLSHACIESLSRRIDAYAVEAAIDALAADYRYHLTEAQYLALATIDRAKTNTGTSPMLAGLVGTGALLEYNAGSWRRSHPVVRTLAGYAVACDKLRPRLIETAAV